MVTCTLEIVCHLTLVTSTQSSREKQNLLKLVCSTHGAQLKKFIFKLM